MPRHAFESTPLFGGAIVVDLPSNFADVSKLRQVPDNQEVYIDKDGFTSIIVDITERVGPAGGGLEKDGRALTTHLEELVGDDADTVKVWNTTETQLSLLPEGIPAYTLIATQTPRAASEESRQRNAAPDFTALILTLVRLEKENTDILITINVPHIKGEYDEEDVDLALGKQGELIGDAVEYAARIWETFNVKDWNLFNEV
ncbi:putative ran guanine nucleotide release factor [Podospora australis]|uniref:Ran guanine nucleotide release factor n=1 Tax=Podospora australis TaxID=1536484 RepID=A0AAN7AM73_9PEZI|nr:putative ran guanine nucleotide release factor [Podospora australis]